MLVEGAQTGAPVMSQEAGHGCHWDGFKLLPPMSQEAGGIVGWIQAGPSVMSQEPGGGKDQIWLPKHE